MQLSGEYLPKGWWKLVSSDAYLGKNNWFALFSGGLLNPRRLTLQVRNFLSTESRCYFLLVVQLHMTGLFCRGSERGLGYVVTQDKGTSQLPVRRLSSASRSLCAYSDAGVLGERERRKCRASSGNRARVAEIENNWQHYSNYKGLLTTAVVNSNRSCGEGTNLDCPRSNKVATVQPSKEGLSQGNERRLHSVEWAAKPLLSNHKLNRTTLGQTEAVLTMNRWREHESQGIKEVSNRLKRANETVSSEQFKRRRLSALPVENEEDGEAGKEIGTTQGYSSCQSEILENMFVVIWKALKESEVPYALPVWEVQSTREEILFSIQNDAVVERLAYWTETWMFSIAMLINVVSSSLVALGAAYCLHCVLHIKFYKDLLTEDPLVKNVSHRLDNEVTSTRVNYP